ncbi:MAG TPA: hypothetical protein VFJ02_07150 [Vicinamibacterales bacterium]|nr:hypothetical protein [Vicinamibacterales bacterium]
MCRRLALLVLMALLPHGIAAQQLPSGPVTAFDGRLSVGGEVSGTFGAEDHSAYFNYTDYEYNALRMLRIALAAAWRPATRLELVGEVRSEDLDQVRAYAAYLRVRPWPAHAFDVQVGRIPPSFGAYGRRAYQSDNGFIGYPLAYQYITSLRPDAIPATVADLLVMRGRGWQASYPVGSQEPGPGVPLISAFRWDTGVQAHWEGRRVEATGGITAGTLAAPRARDDNDGKQLSGRVAVRPVIGLIVGASAARGEFLSKDVIALLPDQSGPHAQTAFGADGEYSRDHWLVRGELIWSRWNMPLTTPQTTEDLDALSGWIEGRYRITPRIVAAARFDRLSFSSVQAGTGIVRTWDAGVRRFEADAGYYLQRNLMLRFAVQHNERDGGRVRSRTYLSGQIAYWF